MVTDYSLELFGEKIHIFSPLTLSFFVFLAIYSFASFTVFPKIISHTLQAVGIDTQSTQSNNTRVEVSPTVIVPPTETPTPTRVPSMVPFEIVIPKLNIRTEVEHVGQTKNLTMDVPKNAANVAWYVYGPKPGEVGNAVINGHFDTPSGAPAVFYRLRQLAIGDELTIISEDGIEQTFVVTGKDKHKYTEFPNEFVFHTKPGKNVNLITCDGIWDIKNAIYNDRLVVYTSLKE